MNGDTVTIDFDLGMGVNLPGQTVRLMCVDTPELRGDELQRGKEVRDQVREWVVNKPVIVRIHGRGKYGRWLGTVRPIGWQESVNARLLRGGLAVIPPYVEGCEP